MKHYLSAICSQTLRIPPVFIDKYGILPQTTKLEGPGGRSWLVVVRKVDGDFFFQDGWPEFVKDNALEELDFLTFVYCGPNFYVKIFGKNLSRKNVIPNYQENCTKEQLHSTILDGKSTCSLIIPQFEVILSSTYVTRCLNVLKQFSQSYVKPYSDSVRNGRGRPKAILQIQDKSWEVNLSRTGCRYQFTKGWPTFAKENLLEEGDRCKFELIRRNPFELRVIITELL